MLLALLVPATAADQTGKDNCPPRYRRGSPDLPAAKAAKKASMRARGLPERLLSLIDRLECVACVETAPDGFSILVVYKEEFAPKTSDGRAITSHTHAWHPQSEMHYREELAAGRIEKFYIMNAGTRCQCCPDIYDDNKTQEDYDDWNDDLDIHEDIMQEFDDPSDLGPLPEDLQNPPREWTTRVPPLRQFTKPSWRVVQALCPKCAGLADAVNNANRELDRLWDRKVTLMERINIIQRATIERDNQIARLRYRQLYAATRSTAQAEEMAQLEEINDAQSSDLRRAIDELEGIDAKVAALNGDVARLMKALQDCENSCRTAAATAVSSNQPTERAPAPDEPSRTPADPPAVPVQPPPATSTGTTGTAPPPATDAMQQGGTTTKPAPGAPSTAPGGTPPVGSPRSDPPQSSPPAMCPDCAAAATEVARLGARIQEQQAEQARLREAQAVNQGNINNLAHMRRDAAGRNDAARVAEYEQRIAELEAANRQLRAEHFKAQEAIEQLNEALARMMRELEACNRACAAQTGAIPGGGIALGTASDPRERTVAAGPLAATAACTACEPLAAELRKAHGELVELAERANALQRDDLFQDFEEQRIRVAALQRQLAECNAKCVTTAATSPPQEPTNVADSPDLDPATSAGCYGVACASRWRECLDAGTCPDVDLDCGIANNCSSPCPPGEVCSSVDGPPDSSWFPCQGCELDPAYQLKIVVTFQDGTPKTYGVDPRGNLVIPPTPQQGAREWFNPLGLLARAARDMVERWRGSIGPRPLLNVDDLKALEPYTGGQALGLPKGVHMLLMDRGGSTGKTLSLQVLNLTGRPFRLSGSSFAVEPIKREAQQRVQQAFSRVARAAPINVDLAGYCLEMLKLPPGSDTLMRIAPAAVQKRFQQMSRVLKSAYRVHTAGVLNPDSEPGAYADSIKQWAVWSVEQKFTQDAFTEAFVQHTRKNVEAARQPWQKQLEDVVRQAAPNRWRDIVKVLEGAGLQAR